MLTERQKKICTFGIPLVLALGAAVTHSIAIQRAVQTGRFLVLKKDLEEGAILERDDLASVELAERFIPQGAIRGENLEATIKTRTRRSLATGKLLFTDDITGSLRSLEADKSEKAIPILVNSNLIATQDLDAGDYIFILASATKKSDGQPLEYPEYGPYRILKINQRDGSDSRLQRFELAIPNDQTAAIGEIGGHDGSRKIINLRKAKKEQMISVFVNRHLIAEQGLATGDHIFIQGSATKKSDGKPVQHPEYGPFQIHEIKEQDQSDNQFQILELAIPIGKTTAIREISGSDEGSRIIKIRKDKNQD